MKKLIMTKKLIRKFEQTEYDKKRKPFFFGYCLEKFMSKVGKKNEVNLEKNVNENFMFCK